MSIHRLPEVVPNSKITKPYFATCSDVKLQEKKYFCLHEKNLNIYYLNLWIRF